MTWRGERAPEGPFFTIPVFFKPSKRGTRSNRKDQKTKMWDLLSGFGGVNGGWGESEYLEEMLMPVSKRLDSPDRPCKFPAAPSSLGGRERTQMQALGLFRWGRCADWGGTATWQWLIVFNGLFFLASGSSFSVLNSFVSPSSCCFWAISFFICKVLVSDPLRVSQPRCFTVVGSEVQQVSLPRQVWGQPKSQQLVQSFVH